MCPLPLFHVFAAYPILMSCLMTGAQMVMPTPQGYRGEGVMDNFWKLIERHGVTFLITVPTAVAALMQRKVDADVSTLRLAISGSAAMPVELFHRFEEATGVKVMEGYGMTEATCLVSINPPVRRAQDRQRRLSLSLHRRAHPALRRRGRGDPEGMRHRRGGRDLREEPRRQRRRSTPTRRGTAASSPTAGISGPAISGAIDADGYIWITGRAKDLIIRGGHNIDPAMIEDAMMQHPAVAFAGAIGQPDARAGRAAGGLCRAGRRRRPPAWRSSWRMPATTSRSRRRCRSISRSWPSCRRPPSARSSSPTCAAAPSRGSSTRRWPRRERGAGGGGGRGPPARPGRRGGARAGGPTTTRGWREVLGRFTVPWRWRDADAAGKRA